MNVLKLTLVNGDPVWISADRIDMMVKNFNTDDDDNVISTTTSIWVGGSEIPTEVTERAQDIARKMCGLREVRS